MPHQLDPLPFSTDALEPHMSAETLALHHGGHHRGYVTKLNELLEGSRLMDAPLEEIIRLSAAGLLPDLEEEDSVSVFNNAAQIWNHDFFWRSLSPQGGGEMPRLITDLVCEVYGSEENFRTAFVDAGLAVFGTGWIWLVHEGDGLHIVTTEDADTPIAHGLYPVLTCDVWEHAYYLDYQNKRADFLQGFLVSLVNWEFAQHNLEARLA